MIELTKLGTCLLVGGLLGAVILYLFQPRAEQETAGAQNLAARVGSVDITLQQLRTAVREESQHSAGTADIEDVLTTLIEEAALEDRARECGFLKMPAHQLACRRFIGDRLKEQQLVPELESMIPTETECKQYYEAHPDKYTVPEHRRLAVLRLTGSAVASEAQTDTKQQRMQEALLAAKKLPVHVENFGQLAIQYSDHQATRYRGGDIGWVAQEPHAAWPKAIIDGGFSLEEMGDISDVIKVKHSFYLVRLSALRPPRRKPIADVRDHIRVVLLRKQREACRERFMQTVMEGREVVVHPENFHKLDLDLRRKTSNDPTAAPPQSPLLHPSSSATP